MSIIRFYVCMAAVIIMMIAAVICWFQFTWYIGIGIWIVAALLGYAVFYIDVRLAEKTPLDAPCVLAAAQPGYVPEVVVPDPSRRKLIFLQPVIHEAYR